MNDNMRETIVEAICRFNIEIGIDGNLAPDISDCKCEQACKYCQLVADYVIAKLKEGTKNVK